MSGKVGEFDNDWRVANLPTTQTVALTADNSHNILMQKLADYSCIVQDFCDVTIGLRRFG